MFNGNRRFKLLRRLGFGGMGIVYEALDTERNVRIALKTVRSDDADLLYRLKQEFRCSRPVIHRNVIAIDELHEEHGNYFFTMELLDGDDLAAHFRRLAAGSSGGSSDVTATASPRRIA